MQARTFRLRLSTMFSIFAILCIVGFTLAHHNLTHGQPPRDDIMIYVGSSLFGVAIFGLGGSVAAMFTIGKSPRYQWIGELLISMAALAAFVYFIRGMA